MADQGQRERESRESDVTKFEEQTEEVEEEQREAAQRIAEALEPQDEP
jgi:predicted Zn-dependent protease